MIVGGVRDERRGEMVVVRRERERLNSYSGGLY